MGQPTSRDGEVPGDRRQAAELKHLSKPRKRDYSPSSGERTGSSPNPGWVTSRGVVGLPLKSEKPTVRRKALERSAKKGDSPVAEEGGWVRWHLSSAGHVKSRVKLARPLAKAKYS